MPGTQTFQKTPQNHAPLILSEVEGWAKQSVGRTYAHIRARPT
jgi:hypothetical protein